MSRVRVVSVLVMITVVIAGLPMVVGAADGPGQDNSGPVVSDGPAITDRYPFPVQEVSITRPSSVSLPSGTAMTKTTGTLLSDGFEGSFPGANWAVSVNSGYTDAKWGKSTYRKSAGSASIWCAAAGSASSAAGGNVPDDMLTWAITGPYDLSSSTSGTLDFDLWLETEFDYDYFYWLYSTDGTNFNGFITSTSNGSFETVSQDLTDWGSAGNSLGHPQVWFAFLYASDESNTFEGAYVDEVSLTTDGGGGGSECGTYVLTSDNENNSYSGSADGDWGYCLYNDDAKHPIEFRFDINETNVSSAQLLILAHDVDQLTNLDKPEQDKVYMNDTYLGDLTGANDEDSTTLFTVPPSSLLIGRNWVKILVNQHPSVTDPRKWCVKINQAQLIINGGCTGQASCRSVSTNKSIYDPGETVAVTYEVDTEAASQQVRVESNLVNPSSQIVAGVDNVYTTYGSSNDPKTVNLSLPTGAVGGTYTAEVLIFDNASGQLEANCEETFTVTGGGGSCSLSCSASVPATGQVGVPITFSGSATATGCNDQPEYFWYPDTSTTAMAPGRIVQMTYDQEGTYSWELVVLVDNERCVRNGTITITGGGGGCNLTCNATVPTTVGVGTTVTYRATSSANGCSESPSYFWWTDTSTTATSFEQNPTVTYASPGTYNWELVVVADNERCVRNGTLTVTGGTCNLSCNATVPTTALVGDPVSYRATASASGCGESPSYFWWTDTRTTATVMEQNVTVGYDQPGTYNWKMVAVAGNERCERTGAITIGSTGGAGTTVVWIPVASRADGAFNSTWRTDISIFNPTSITATVAITIYTTSGPVIRVITISPFGQFIQTDVVGWLIPGASLSGAIRIVATQAVVVTTRTYNQFAAGVVCFPLGTLGQALGPLTTTAAIQTGQFGWIPNLTQTIGFRSNIGFTNTSTVVTVVRIDLYNANGTKIGSYTKTLQPGQWWQSNEPFRVEAGNNNIIGGSAKVTVTSGKGVIVYGSVVDNITNDPTTVTMVR
ncbi:MAG: hypothetical protein K8R59_07345 [Thermoanaerobaculales bacterium]|nr:hypothetical protein [Thermoanaerobaculales bacterium]